MDYYGISPSSDFFAHWGVKGMKWGIRKARPTGSGGPHSFAYRRAERKLARLQAKADSKALLRKAARLEKVSRGARVAGRIGLGAATAGTGASVLANKLHSKNIDWANTQHKKISPQIHDDYNLAESGKGTWSTKDVSESARKAHAQIDADYERMQNNAQMGKNIGRSIQAAGAGLGVLGYGTAVGAKLRANALRKRANNAKKMQEARQRAAAYQRQMNQRFGVSASRKRRG